MPYLGNAPAEAYSQISYQDLTGGSGTSFTLDYPVGSAGEIEVFVNNVRQEPTVAYTVSGTSLTMTGSIAATDDFYVVFQGKAQQTIGIPEKQSDGTYAFPDDVTVSGNITLGDNNKAIFGAGSDLQIYHDGSHSYIDEAGTGDIYVSVVDDIIFRTYGTNELVARFNTNQSTGGWARLYHRGSEKLETTSTGVDVTGTITPSGGVYLGDTGSANLLDDYEYGTFTPTYSSSGTPPSGITYDTVVGNEGIYVKNGRAVYIQINIRTDAVTSAGTGSLYIAGLPFATPNLSGQGGVASIYIGSSGQFATNQPTSAQIGESDTNIYLFYRTSANGDTVSMTTSELRNAANTNFIRIGGVYYTTE